MKTIRDVLGGLFQFLPASVEMVAFSALTALIPLAIVTLWLRQRRARQHLSTLPQEAEPLIGTNEDLARAEAELSAQPNDIRKLLLNDHVLLERFPTMRGYSRPYIEDLAQKFEGEGIPTSIHFQETLPLGYASMVERHGVFELYVPFNHAERATELLAEIQKGN